jgi:hypothetical protein
MTEEMIPHLKAFASPHHFLTVQRLLATSTFCLLPPFSVRDCLSNQRSFGETELQ